MRRANGRDGAGASLLVLGGLALVAWYGSKYVFGTLAGQLVQAARPESRTPSVAGLRFATPAQQQNNPRPAARGMA